jgi:hypothetical protein
MFSITRSIQGEIDGEANRKWSGALIGPRKSRVWIVVSSTAAFLIACPGCTGNHSVSAQSEERQSMNSPEVNIAASVSGDEIFVTVVMIDHAAEPFPLLRWNLPSDGRMTGGLFEVDRNGEPQPYVGEMVKRRVTADDYILLCPGKEYKTTVGLKQGYDVKANGEYRIRYRAWNQLPRGGLATITSAAVTARKG